MGLRVLTLAVGLVIYLGLTDGRPTGPCALIPNRECRLFTDLRISAFNIQVFGVTKMGKQHVVDVLIPIIQRYDIVLIQEIRDVSETAIYDLLNQVNAASPSDQFSMVMSARLGRTSSKEQYAYFYRNRILTVTQTWQYPESRDHFERPPYAARFNAPDFDMRDFGFLGLHAKPSEAGPEIDKMTDAYDELVAVWGLPDIILGGDFNAGCSYVRPGDWDYIRLRTQSRFQWLIGDNADTTLAASQCPYDRLVIAGSNLQRNYIGGSANVFNFRSAYGLDNAHALEVSDHYPVAMNVR